ncbi:MAG: glycosyltransferase family 39 protein [Dehalococcoidia bacterium]|nr:glycosyltransferase family 39 protein [Dehalococcoidia bacterium]
MRWAVTLAVILAAALVARLAWTWWTDPTPPELSDPQYYNATALSLARGEGYSVTFHRDVGFLPGGEETAFWPPGYSAYLATFYWLFGKGDEVAQAANVVAGALVVVPIYFIGLRLFGRRIALVAAAAAALLPSLVYWVPVLFSDTLFTLLFAMVAALLLHALRQDGTFSLALLAAGGVVLGLAMLVRGQALVLVPVVAVYWAVAGAKPAKCLLSGGACLALAAAVVVPWSVRNTAAMGSPILLSANVGYNLRVGHAPYSTGRYILPDDLWNSRSERTTFRELEPVFNDLGLERATEYALGHPLEEAELAVRKTLWLWAPDSDALDWVESYGRTPLPAGAVGPLRWLVDGSYAVLLWLVGCAFVRARAFAPQLSLLAALVVLWTATHIVFFGEPRYHLPALALMIPVAAAPLVWLWEAAISQLSPRRAEQRAFVPADIIEGEDREADTDGKNVSYSRAD